MPSSRRGPRTCTFKSPWGRCQQPPGPSDVNPPGHCPFHLHWVFSSGQPDPFYHEKIVKGLLQPALTYLTAEEMRATLGGKYHGDGRRLDSYVTEDPGAP